MADEVSIKKSNGYLRNEMNLKLTNNFKDLFQDYQEYLAKDTSAYKELKQLYISTIDSIINKTLNTYLNPKSTQESSKLAKMGGSLFQNFRICRDLVYTQQSREQRLIGGLRGQLYKAKLNSLKGMAFI